MRPYFVTCSVESIEYQGDIVTNHAVNLSLCKSIQQTKFARYPDNVGKPALKFEGCDIKWVYNTEVQREYDYYRLISNKENAHVPSRNDTQTS